MSIVNLMDEHQAAEALHLKVATLRSWRLRGCGPRFCRLGRAIRYKPDELTAYIDGATYASTTEADRRHVAD